jgi:glycogen debranching enzyme
LFVLLAGAYFERTGDRAFAESLWPSVAAAMDWIDRCGDRDGDGFVEYQRQSADGLVHQGWKDSDDAVFHADGTPARGPIALCEVLGYVYAARRAAAALAAGLGHGDRSREMLRQAESLRARFEQAFWCEDLSIYALALDGDKRPCRVRTSNAGQCLFTGIASPAHAERVAQSLMAEPGFSGWGVRTVASTASRYNPMSYHNGSVWPHDCSLVAAGLGRYGHRDAAARILGGLFDASQHFDLQRLPELFCGFARQPGETPTLYPQACSPQPWAAAAPLQCLQACLGLEVSGTHGRVCLKNPVLPPFLEAVTIRGLSLPQGNLDIAVTRHDGDVGVRLVRREGEAELVVSM